MSIVIEASEVQASYGKVQVLFDVDLCVEEGQTLALLGTNGAGKSTLLRTISGLHPLGSGVIKLDGRDVGRMPTQQRVRLGLSHLLGGEATFGPLTVDENLRAATHRYGSAQSRRLVQDAFEMFPELVPHRSSAAQSLSGGQEQMLALAMSLLHQPRLLLIDELSLGLAPIVVERVLGVVRQLQQSGTTMIVIEQSLNVALSIADRAIFLEHGRVHFEGAASELLERDDLARSVFLGA